MSIVDNFRLKTMSVGVFFGAISSSALLTYVGLKQNNYANRYDLMWFSLINYYDLWAGIVHVFRKEHGLVDYAKMDEKGYKKYEAAIKYFFVPFGTYQIGIGLLNVYFLIYRPNDIWLLANWKLSMTIFELTNNYLREDELNGLVKEALPVNPRKKRNLIVLSMTLLWYSSHRLLYKYNLI